MYYDTAVGLDRDSNIATASVGQTQELVEGTFFTMSMISDGHGVDFLINGERFYRQSDMSFLNDKGGNTFVFGMRGANAAAQKSLLHIDYIEIECERSDVVKPTYVNPQ